MRQTPCYLDRAESLHRAGALGGVAGGEVRGQQHVYSRLLLQLHQLLGPVLLHLLDALLSLVVA